MFPDRGGLSRSGLKEYWREAEARGRVVSERNVCTRYDPKALFKCQSSFPDGRGRGQDAEPASDGKEVKSGQQGLFEVELERRIYTEYSYRTCGFILLF